MVQTPAPPRGRTARTVHAPALLTTLSVVLVAVAMVVPPLADWHVYANGLAPLSALWRPRVGAGTVPALLVAAAAWRWGDGLARGQRWGCLLLTTFAAGLLWALSLALVDGRAGLAAPLDTGGYSDYLSAARQVHGLSALLHEFVARIPSGSVGAWPTHVAGHPPGALLFFVLLVRVGLGGGLLAGLTVTALGATVPVAVLMTLRRLGAEPAARRAAVVVTLGPSAIWSAVSGDAVFAAVLAWGVCVLAHAATSRHSARISAWGIAAGVLFGATLLMSYGLVVAGTLALAVLLAARSWRAALPAAGATVAVLVAFAAGGFSWWRALPVLHERYYAGLASVRPASYWVWGDVAALVFCAGPVLGASLALAWRRLPRWRRAPQPVRVVVLLTSAAAASIALADASLMSKAEVERIWLPFVPWLLLGTALLPGAWRRRVVGAQLAAALLVQSVLFTHW